MKIANKLKEYSVLYPVSVEINKNKVLELKFSVQNQNGEQSVLNLLLELDQLVSDKRTVINISMMIYLISHWIKIHVLLL